MRSPFLLLVSIAAIAVVYFLSAKLGFELAFVAEQVTAVWPPTGIALAALMIFGFRVWPGIFIGAFWANVTTGETVATAIAIGCGNTLEALAGAWLMRRVGFRNSLDRFPDVFALIILSAGLGTVVSATIGTASLCATGIQDWSRFWSLWSVWWLGDAMGSLVVAPFLLAWTTKWNRKWATGTILEAAGLTIALVAISAIVFDGKFPGFNTHYAYAVFPVVVWGALRFTQRGTSTATFLISAMAILGTVKGMGPFARESVHESLILLQTFMAVVAITGLLLAAAISERQQAELALTEADRRKDEFLATLGHELRNPLAPIRTGLDLMKIAGNDPNVLEEIRGTMERQIHQMVRLIDDLLDVSRITRGKLRLQKGRVDFGDVVRNAVETTRPVIAETRHELTVLLPELPIFVEGDAVRLAQILANLLNNAAKYTPAGGKISLSVSREGGNLLVSVKDTGIGIPAEMLPRIFEMFAQVDRTLDRPTSGLGIGLTLTKSLIELHGGTIVASSGGLNCGSEFLVRLPVAELGPTTAISIDRARDLPRESKGCRVLVVDDNRDAAEMMEMALKMLGHEVRVAFDGQAAVQLAESFRPDAAFLDLGMPTMNGHEVARAIRSSPWGAETLLIALSGWGQEEDKRRAREAGFDFHFAKPVETSVLQDLLNEMKHPAAKVKSSSRS